MRICFDLDGTICENKRTEQLYMDVKPLPGAVEAIQDFHKNGHYIIISTARHMKTCNGNLGLILARQGEILFRWLRKYNIPYDEVWFQKPLADLYVDDKGHKFTSWDNVRKEVNK